MKRDVRLAVVTSLAPRSGLVLGRFILGLVVSVCVVFPTTTVAAKGSGGHGSSGRASVTNGGASKTVHVGPYTRKDGTHVNAYDRREPGSTSDRPTSLADLAQTTAARRAGAANQNRLQMRPSLADLASVQANRNAIAAQPGTLTNTRVGGGDPHRH